MSPHWIERYYGLSCGRFLMTLPKSSNTPLLSFSLLSSLSHSTFPFPLSHSLSWFLCSLWSDQCTLKKFKTHPSIILVLHFIIIINIAYFSVPDSWMQMWMVCFIPYSKTVRSPEFSFYSKQWKVKVKHIYVLVYILDNSISEASWHEVEQKPSQILVFWVLSCYTFEYSVIHKNKWVNKTRDKSTFSLYHLFTAFLFSEMTIFCWGHVWHLKTLRGVTFLHYKFFLCIGNFIVKH